MSSKLYKPPQAVDEPCNKVELANAYGIRLIYCASCQVVELEIGAISLRLCPDMVQRIANVMMKASLRLDHALASQQPAESSHPQPKMLH